MQMTTEVNVAPLTYLWFGICKDHSGLRQNFLPLPTLSFCWCMSCVNYPKVTHFCSVLIYGPCKLQKGGGREGEGLDSLASWGTCGQLCSSNKFCTIDIQTTKIKDTQRQKQVLEERFFWKQFTFFWPFLFLFLVLSSMVSLPAHRSPRVIY